MKKRTLLFGVLLLAGCETYPDYRDVVSRQQNEISSLRYENQSLRQQLTLANNNLVVARAQARADCNRPGRAVFYPSSSADSDSSAHIDRMVEVDAIEHQTQAINDAAFDARSASHNEATRDVLNRRR